MSGRQPGDDADDADCVHNPMLVGAATMILEMAHDPRFMRRDLADMAVRTVVENALAVKALAQAQEILSGASARMLADLAAVGWDWAKLVEAALARGDAVMVEPTDDTPTPKGKPH